MRARGVELRAERGDDTVADTSDAALLSGCALGERVALGRLFDRHHAVVRRFLERQVRAASGDADDLVQETFLEVWASAPRYRGHGSVRSWIFGIAANVARHHVRDEVRRRGALAACAEPEPVRGPDDAAERTRLRRRLSAALAALPDALRVAFVLCVLDEVPGVEVARRLGLHEGTLWRRLHEARRALREHLES